MSLDESFGDGEAQAAASGGRIGRAKEFVKNARQKFRRYSRTTIGNAEEEAGVDCL
jgi:hypothetical protein